MKKKFFKKVICLISALLVLASIIIVPIGAADENTADDSAEVNKTIWEQYPMLNLIPFDYASASGVYDGIEVVVNDDGTINTYGTAITTESYFTVITIYEGEGIEIPDYVTFSCSGLTKTASILIRFSDNDKYFIFSDDEPITFNKKNTKIERIALRIRNNDKVDDTMHLEPMLNAGTVAYPYQPNINALLNQYYQNGYNEAMQKADCEYNAEIENSDEYAEHKIDAKNMAELLYPNLKNPNLANNDLTWFVRGYCDKAMNLGFHYNCCAEHNSFYLSGWDQIKIDNADEFYNSGYNVGKNEGLDKGYKIGITQGRTEGYNEGYSIGKTESYNEGYTNGYDDCYEEQMAKNNTHIFTDATYTAHIYCDFGSGQQKIASLTIEPNRYQNSIDFANLIDALYSYSLQHYGELEYLESYCDKVEIEINWPTEKAFDLEKFPIYIYGSSDVSSGTITNTNNKTYAVNANPTIDDMRKFTVEKAGEELKHTVKKFTLKVGRPFDLLQEFTLYSESEAYNVGYNEGFKSGTENGEAIGYNNGYSNGFLQGKAEGLSLGEGGNWRELMNAIVEAPVNTFRSLFNFEILGLDMRAAFGSVLALCMLLLIIKKVIL